MTARSIAEHLAAWLRAHAEDRPAVLAYARALQRSPLGREAWSPFHQVLADLQVRAFIAGFEAGQEAARRESPATS